jgi:hypothetical protein
MNQDGLGETPEVEPHSIQLICGQRRNLVVSSRDMRHLEPSCLVIWDEATWDVVVQNEVVVGQKANNGPDTEFLDFRQPLVNDGTKNGRGTLTRIARTTPSGELPADYPSRHLWIPSRVR